MQILKAPNLSKKQNPYIMKKGRLIFGVLCLAGAGAGFYYTDNFNPTIPCAMWTIMLPMIVGAIFIAMAFYKRRSY